MLEISHAEYRSGINDFDNRIQKQDLKSLIGVLCLPVWVLKSFSSFVFRGFIDTSAYRIHFCSGCRGKCVFRFHHA